MDHRTRSGQCFAQFPRIRGTIRSLGLKTSGGGNRPPPGDGCSQSRHSPGVTNLWLETARQTEHPPKQLFQWSERLASAIFFQKFISSQNLRKVFGGTIKICSESTFVGSGQKSSLRSQK
jgi:hypothetical protein